MIAMSNKKGKEVNRKVLIERGTFGVTVEEFKKEVAPLTQHLFKAAWQVDQFTSLRAKMPESEGWGFRDLPQSTTMKYPLLKC